MRSLTDMLAAFLADESGATAIEYALIVSGIAISIIASLNAIGASIGGVFSDAGAH